jgi:tRNA pseudouridine13 synthase
MFGASMRKPEAEAAQREQAVFERGAVSEVQLQAHAKLGEGTRRAARVRITEPQVEAIEGGLRLSFELPSGAYATTVLREIMKEDAD